MIVEKDKELKALEILREQCDALGKYAVLEGSEIGEACQCLIALAGYTDYMSPELVKELSAEIYEQLSYFQMHSKIVERRRTKPETYTCLEWK